MLQSSSIHKPTIFIKINVMEYNLLIETDVDVCIDTQTSLEVYFRPRSKGAYHIGLWVVINAMDLAQLQKFISADIKFFHKVDFESNRIAVFYKNHPLPQGNVLKNMMAIDALPNE